MSGGAWARQRSAARFSPGRCVWCQQEVPTPGIAEDGAAAVEEATFCQEAGYGFLVKCYSGKETLRLVHCRSCKRVADPFLEADVLSLLVNAAVLDAPVLTHLIHNRVFRTDALGASQLSPLTVGRAVAIAVLFQAILLLLRIPLGQPSPQFAVFGVFHAHRPFEEYTPLLITLVWAALLTACELVVIATFTAYSQRLRTTSSLERLWKHDRSPCSGKSSSRRPFAVSVVFLVSHLWDPLLCLVGIVSSQWSWVQNSVISAWVAAVHTLFHRYCASGVCAHVFLASAPVSAVWPASILLHAMLLASLFKAVSLGACGWLHSAVAAVALEVLRVLLLEACLIPLTHTALLAD